MGNFKILKILLVYFTALSLFQLSSCLLSENIQKYSSITDALQKLYKSKLLPLEQASEYQINETPLIDADFEGKPIVLLFGEYSSGKTTLISYLIGEKYQGAAIGPEPTTDNFIYVNYGKKRELIDGRTIIAHPKSPFRELAKFEAGFLNNFKASELPIPILESIAFVDTPGVLAGATSQNKREYDFVKALEWFAEHSDRILLLFDSSKIDISPEMEKAIRVVMKYEEKIRIILNKAHTFEEDELVHIYGGLKFNLAKVIDKLEKPRVYLTSFKDGIGKMFPNMQKDHDDILKDLRDLPSKSSQSKLSKFTQRVRRVLMHAYLIKEIQANLPWFFSWFRNKTYYVRVAVDNANNLIDKIKKKHPFLSLTSNYDPYLIKDKFLKLDYGSIKISDNLIERASEILQVDIEHLLDMLQNEKEKNIDFKNKNTEL